MMFKYPNGISSHIGLKHKYIYIYIIPALYTSVYNGFLLF